MTKDERLYIAAPVCFYPRGRSIWLARRKTAEYYGFQVTCPSDPQNPPPKTDDLKEKSKALFGNCDRAMNDSTAIIADLENYRGFMPDGGTVFEVGMAYGRGLKMYAYTRDKRGNGVKYYGANYTTHDVLTVDGKKLPNKQFPFDTCLTASCKMVEGDFDDALRVFMEDLEAESKAKARRGYVEKKAQPCVTIKHGDRPIVYVATSDRYDDDVEKKYRAMRKILDEAGFDAIFPTDPAPGVPQKQYDDPMAQLYQRFDNYQQHVRNCDIILADLCDYLGYEPASDVGFECGMAYELNKKLFGYMDNAGPVKDRIVCTLCDDGGYEDINHMRVENLGAAQNLMFGASFDILGGGFESAVKQMKEKLQG